MHTKCKAVWVSAALLCSCQARHPPGATIVEQLPVALVLKSAAFEEGGILPQKYTCNGSKVSPPLSWGAVPGGTKTLAVVCEDPDAPGGVFSHWVLFNLPAASRSLPENAPATARLKDGTVQGQNDFGSTGYGAPCPPGGVHRYQFELFALDRSIQLGPDATRKTLLDAMKGHILASGELTGKYGKGD